MATEKFALAPKRWTRYACGMSPEQCRAARAWLDWKQDRLAAEAGVGLSTVKGFEAAKSKPIGATLAAMRVALERAGVAFVDGETWGITGPKPGAGPATG